MHLLITGERNAGKSTLIERALGITGVTVGGFKSQANILNGKIEAFVIRPLGHQKIDPPSDSRIGIPGKYNWKGFPETFDTLGVEILKNALSGPEDVLLMDELGFFETEALAFQEKVLECLNQTTKKVIAVVKAMDTPFLEQVKKHPNTHLLTLTVDNREVMLAHVIKWVQEAINERTP